MGGDVTLDEDGRAIRIEPAREQDRGEVERRLTKLRRILRQGDRVQVHDDVEGVELVLVGHPLPDGADVVPQVNFTRGLNARQDARHRVRV
jgi:hypothetical protein